MKKKRLIFNPANPQILKIPVQTVVIYFFSAKSSILEMTNCRSGASFW